MKAKGKNVKLWLALLLGLVVVPPLVWFLSARLEGTDPVLEMDNATLTIGVSGAVQVTVADPKSGLRRVWISIIQDGKEVVLLEKDFAKGGLFSAGSVKKANLTVEIFPEKIAIADGTATLRLMASDYSWRRWWHGNRVYRERPVTIDTRPPEISVLTRVHNLSQGGSGLVIYKLSEACPISGVKVGDNFFPGHAGQFDDAQVYMALFALSHNQGKGTRIALSATDAAGNSSRAGFPHYIRRRTFRKDTLRITDGFLNAKMPEFAADVRQGSERSLKDIFLEVNRTLRENNYRTVQKIGSHTEPMLLWDGPFLRLPNAATRAKFADQRAYLYNGQVIDHQVHLGIDLASVAHSPVPASNSGKIAFVGSIGIYGKTVMIDHGYGLFSMYSHLSAIDVRQGQQVAKRDVIGRTGKTGLAGGDHLHFGILVHNIFVNPLEWWDAAWIRNNITGKIDGAAAEFGKGSTAGKKDGQV